MDATDHHGFHPLGLCPVRCSPVPGEYLDEESAGQAACQLGVRPRTGRRGAARLSGRAQRLTPGVSGGGFSTRRVCGGPGGKKADCFVQVGQSGG